MRERRPGFLTQSVDNKRKTQEMRNIGRYQLSHSKALLWPCTLDLPKRHFPVINHSFECLTTEQAWCHQRKQATARNTTSPPNIATAPWALHEQCMIARNTPGGISSAGVGRCPNRVWPERCKERRIGREGSTHLASGPIQLRPDASCHCGTTLVGVDEVLTKLIGRRVPSVKRREVLRRPDLPITLRSQSSLKCWKRR